MHTTGSLTVKSPLHCIYLRVQGARLGPFLHLSTKWEKLCSIVLKLNLIGLHGILDSC